MPYYVFERNDGYFGVINSSEKLAHGQVPERLRGYSTPDGKRVTFTVLLQSNDWDECVRVLQDKRGVIDAIIDTKPPVDPAKVRRRTIDGIAVQLKSVRERLRHAHGEIAELHGVGHPAQSTLEIALVALNDAIRFNDQESKS